MCDEFIMCLFATAIPQEMQKPYPINYQHLPIEHQSPLKGMNHITLAVSDVERSFHFYRVVLGLNPICIWDKGAYFTVGDIKKGFWFVLNYDPNRIPEPAHCYTHYAFSVDQPNFDKLTKRITAFGTKIFKNNTSEGDSLYFLDPDGHKLEIHVGDLNSRIAEKQANPGNWKNITWFTAKL